MAVGSKFLVVGPLKNIHTHYEVIKSSTQTWTPLPLLQLGYYGINFDDLYLKHADSLQKWCHCSLAHALPTGM